LKLSCKQKESKVIPYFKKGDLVEVTVDIDKQYCHFLAEVERTSNVSSETVTLIFKNKLFYPPSPFGTDPPSVHQNN